jgi:serine O-acetyltransferase
VRKLLTPIYWLMFRLVETAIGISIPKSAVIGPGLRIWHFGGIFLHADVVVGTNCTLRQGVTIGNRHENGPVPIIGHDVNFGAYAQVLGGIRIGNDCQIGAMSVVLCDVPDGATAVGAPARIILRKTQ